MYANLFEACYNHSVAKKDGGNAFIKYCDFLRQCRTDPGITADLLKKTPLHVLTTNNAGCELVRHAYDLVREYVPLSPSGDSTTTKMISLCIPVFEFDAKEKQWLVTKSVRKIWPTRVDETSMVFEFDLKASELYNHYNLHNYDTQNYARTAYYDDSIASLFDARSEVSLYEDVVCGNDVDFLRLFISFDMLDSRSVSEEHVVLKCYSSITITFGQEYRVWTISPNDADDSSFTMPISVRVNTLNMLDYFSHMMAMNDVKKCYYDLKLGDIFTSVDGVETNAYFRNIWYRNKTLVERAKKLCPNMALKDDDDAQCLNVATQLCHNADLLEYVKLNIADNPPESEASWDERFDRYRAVNRTTNNNDGTSACGYIFEHDVECRGNYGWFDSSKTPCKRKHFPTLAPYLRSEAADKAYVINVEAANVVLREDFANAFRDYLRLRFNVTLSEQSSQSNVCYEFCVSKESPTEMKIIMSRIDEIKSILFRQSGALRAIPYDVMRRDIVDEENECSSLTRSSLRFLAVRNLTLYKSKEMKLKDFIQNREEGRAHSGFAEGSVKTNLGVFKGILRRPRIHDVHTLSRQLTCEKYPYDEWMWLTEWNDFVTWRSHRYGDLLYECSSVELPRVRALNACDTMYTNDVFGSVWRKVLRTSNTETVILRNAISAIIMYHLYRSVAINMAARTNDEYPYAATHSVDGVYSDACFGCAKPIWRYYEWIRTMKYPKSHIYTIRGLALSVSVPRHDSKKSYIGCCGYLSNNRYHFYGVYPDDNISEAFDSSEQLHVQIMQGLNDVCDKVPRGKKESKRLEHYVTEGGIKSTFIHDMTSFAARHHHGYLNIVDFDLDLMYGVISGVSGLPRTLAGATDRQRGPYRVGYGKRERCFEFLNTIEIAISTIKMEWRKLFCDIKTKITRALHASPNIIVDKSLQTALRSYNRTGLSCVVREKEAEYGDHKRRIACAEKQSQSSAEYPIDVRTDWCFSPHAYSAVKRLLFEMVKDRQPHAKPYHEDADESTANKQFSLGRLFARKTCKFEDVKCWKDCDDRLLFDKTVAMSLYVLKIRATMAPYVKMVSILEGVDCRLSLSDSAYCIVEDYVFDNCETDLRYRDGSKLYEIDKPVLKLCDMLRNVVVRDDEDDADIHTSNTLSYYNAIRAIVYNWTHSFIMSEISMVVKYERLLEGVLYRTSDIDGVEVFKRSGPESAKVNRRFGLDFFLGLRILFDSRDIVHFNQPLSKRIGVPYTNESYFYSRSQVGDVFLSAIGKKSTSYANTIKRCQCIDCACGSVNTLSEYGGFYSCSTTVTSTLSNSPHIVRFDYVFGVRRHYLMATTNKQATIDLYDNATTVFAVLYSPEEPTVSSGGIFYGRRDKLDRMVLKNVASQLKSSADSLYNHAWRCCEYVAQQKIHDAVAHRATTFVTGSTDERSSCIKMILCTSKKVADSADDVKKFESEDYIYLYDLETTNVFRSNTSLMKAEASTLWTMLLSKHMGLGEDYVFGAFGYAEFSDAHRIATISRFTSNILTFFTNLPTARISQNSSAKISPYIPTVKCTITKDAHNVKPDFTESSLFVETTIDTGKINLFDKGAPTWCCIPLFMLVFRTYLNLAPVLDEMFDPRKSILFKDAKYILSTKLKMSLYLCIKLGSVKIPRLPKRFDGEFVNPFAFEDHSEAMSAFHNKGEYSHGPVCNDGGGGGGGGDDDSLLSDVSDILKGLGDFALNFYNVLIRRHDDDNSDDDDDDEDGYYSDADIGERPLKKRRTNDTEHMSLVTDDLWREDFGKKCYTERELANAVYAQAITNYSILFKSREGLEILSKMQETVENAVVHYHNDPSFFLSSITNVLWYDGAKLYCEKRYVMETENTDIINDVNEFI